MVLRTYVAGFVGFIMRLEQIKLFVLSPAIYCHIQMEGSGQIVVMSYLGFFGHCKCSKLTVNGFLACNFRLILLVVCFVSPAVQRAWRESERIIAGSPCLVLVSFRSRPELSPHFF